MQHLSKSRVQFDEIENLGQKLIQLVAKINFLKKKERKFIAHQIILSSVLVATLQTHFAIYKYHTKVFLWQNS